MELNKRRLEDYDLFIISDNNGNYGIVDNDEKEIVPMIYKDIVIEKCSNGLIFKGVTSDEYVWQR